MSTTPCSACPFRREDRKPLPESGRAHAEGIIAGSLAFCHTSAGPCIGAAMFRANVLCPGRHPSIPDTVAEFLAR